MPHIRVSSKTKKAFDELQGLMKAAFKKPYTQDGVVQELLRSKVDLKIDVKFPRELVKNIEAIQKNKRLSLIHI